MSALLNTHELAKLLGLAEITPRQWRARGEGPPYIKIGKAVRYRMADVEAWLESRRIGGAAGGR